MAVAYAPPVSVSPIPSFLPSFIPNSMSITSPSTLALDIYEIVALIGQFLPLWSTTESGFWKGSPGTLLRLCRVSRTWYHAFVPIVWRRYHLDVMKNVPAHVLKKNAVHTRFLHSFDGTLSTFSIKEASFPQLTHVTLDDIHRPSIPPLRNEPTMTHLDSSYLRLAKLGLDWAVQLLSSPFCSTVKHLRLEYLYCGNFLYLHRILFCLPHLTSLHLSTMGHGLNAFSQPPFTKTSLLIKELGFSLYHFEEILRYPFLERFVQCCPELEKILVDIEGLNARDINKVMEDPRVKGTVALVYHFCPRFKTLWLRGDQSPQYTKNVVHDASIAVSGPNQGKVIQLKLSLAINPAYEAFWFIGNGETLKVLDLQILLASRNSYKWKKWVIYSLCSRNLESLTDLRIVGKPKFDIELSRCIIETEWNCRPHLETLSLGGFSWALRSDNTLPSVPVGSHSSVQWRPKEGIYFEEDLDDLMQHRLQELPKLSHLTLNTIPFVKV